MHAQNLLNPLLESDNIECAHKGKVLLQSSTKAIAKLYICMIMHDKEAFENYIYDKSHRAKSTISNWFNPT